MGQKLDGSQLELYRRADEILHYLWDPIGIAGEPGARDEYDDYLPKVFALLNEGENAIGLSDYLLEITVTRMGLAKTDVLVERSVRAAEKIVEWKVYLSNQLSS